MDLADTMPPLPPMREAHKVLICRKYIRNKHLLFPEVREVVCFPPSEIKQYDNDVPVVKEPSSQLRPEGSALWEDGLKMNSL
jgi:hypothetical protein